MTEYTTLCTIEISVETTGRSLLHEYLYIFITQHECHYDEFCLLTGNPLLKKIGVVTYHQQVCRMHDIALTLHLWWALH